jgi:K+-transporting ATPase ATPase A chain
MMARFVAGLLVCWWAEAQGNPIHQGLGVAAGDGNLEGKEVRFGIFSSASGNYGCWSNTRARC